MENDAKSRRILVVDDDEHLRKFITRGLSRAGFETFSADSGASGIALLREQSFDCVLCDLHMPEVDGLDVLRFAAGLSPPPPFIVITGYGSVSVAVEAMKHGAADFLEKPVGIEELRATILAVFNRKVPAIVAPSPARPPLVASLQTGIGLVGSRGWLEPFLESLARIAQTDSTVLIEGETGTGKSAVAREIAKRSTRAGGPFVELNCAAIPEQLLENELFGHVRGAYTTAPGQTGKVEHASGGTLFLDEVGELKHELQAKLLQLLQNRTFTPIGALKPRHADVRFIAATNRNLGRDVDEGRFRADLYYRLNVVSLTIPPLRDRKEDIPLLIEHFCRRISERLNAQPPVFSPEALAVLSRHRWPGNVRELENLVERMAVMHPGRSIAPELLGDRFRDEARSVESARLPPQRSDAGSPALFEPPPSDVAGLSFKEAVVKFESTMIKKALANAGGNQTRAAKILNMNRTTLIEKMKKLGIESFEDDSEHEPGDPSASGGK